MGQVTSIDNNTETIEENHISQYQKNKDYYYEIKDQLIEDWQNEEYPVWILIHTVRDNTKPKIYFSEEDVYSSIYYHKDAFIVKIPQKTPTAPLASTLLDQFNLVIDTVVDLITPDEPPIQHLTNDLADFENTCVHIPRVRARPQYPLRDYEFIYNQYFCRIPIKLAIVLEGRLIGVQFEKTGKFQWFAENINHEELKYNLLMQ